MKNYHVVEIFKVLLGNILLELHLNAEFEKKRLSLNMSIEEDGETILITHNSKWFKPLEITPDSDSTYSTFQVAFDEDLGKLLNDEIQSIHLGVSKTLDNKDSVIHYLKMTLKKNEFLFFNNGDEGAYSFDVINDIIKNDIYQCEWVENLYASQFLSVGN